MVARDIKRSSVANGSRFLIGRKNQHRDLRCLRIISFLVDPDGVRLRLDLLEIR